MWYWRRLLRVPWTARRSSQSILREISPRCSLEGLMLKVKLQYLVHLIQRADSFEKTLMLERLRAEWEGVTAHEMVGWHHCLNGHEFEQTPGDGQRQRSQVFWSPWGSQTVGHNLATEQQQQQNRGCGFDPWVPKISWRRIWQLTPIFLPGKSHGQRSLVGYSPGSLKIARYELATKH